MCSTVCTEDTSEDLSLGKYFQQMSLFDNAIGINIMTVNYDPIHLAKRFRNALISERKLFAGSREILKSDMMDVLDSNKKHSKISSRSLLDPDDKQNVKYATEILGRIDEFSKMDDRKLSFRLCQVAPEIKLLGHVYRGILVHYSFSNMPINDILEHVSIAVHVLLVLFIKADNGLLSSQLYITV